MGHLRRHTTRPWPDLMHSRTSIPLRCAILTSTGCSFGEAPRHCRRSATLVCLRLRTAPTPARLTARTTRQRSMGSRATSALTTSPRRPRTLQARLHRANLPSLRFYLERSTTRARTTVSRLLHQARVWARRSANALPLRRAHTLHKCNSASARRSRPRLTLFLPRSQAKRCSRRWDKRSGMPSLALRRHLLPQQQAARRLGMLKRYSVFSMVVLSFVSSTSRNVRHHPRLRQRRLRIAWRTVSDRCHLTSRMRRTRRRASSLGSVPVLRATERLRMSSFSPISFMMCLMRSVRDRLRRIERHPSSSLPLSILPSSTQCRT